MSTSGCIRVASGWHGGLWLAGLLVIAAIPAPGAAEHGRTERISVNAHGEQGDDHSGGASISHDGRYVAFTSAASNLVPEDTNGLWDVFVADRLTGAISRVSVRSDGTQITGAPGSALSFGASISGDGRYVAFESDSPSLVPETGPYRDFDIFVHDRLTGITERISRSSEGVEGKGDSREAAISADGRYVAFQSWANNLVPGDTSSIDVFVHDRLTGITSLISRSHTGGAADGSSGSPAISADGRFIAFHSDAANLIADDTNNHTDVFVRDMHTATTSLISIRPDGIQGSDISWNPTISADGSRIAFETSASNLHAPDRNLGDDILVHDRTTGELTRVSQTSTAIQLTGPSAAPQISADGTTIAFWSITTGLLLGIVQVEVWVHHLPTRTTSMVSPTYDGTPSDGASWWPAISADGRYVAFDSWATNHVPDDTNGALDVFVRDRGTPPCPQGWREEGTLTSHLHHHEQPDPHIHDASCNAVRYGL